MGGVGQSRALGWVFCCGAVSSAWLGAQGCSETEPRPSVAGDCNDEDCTEVRQVPPALGGGAMASGGGSGSGGAAGGGGFPAPQVGTLAGSVRMIVEPDLLGVRSLDGTVEVRAPGATEPEINGQTASDGSFRLVGVSENDELWVAVGAFEDPPSNVFMDTLQVVDSTVASFNDLLVMRRSVMDEIASVAFSNLTEPDPNRGHAIISFVDAQGNGVAGVRLRFPVPEDVSIAYDTGDIYSDQFDETSSRGTVVLFNLVASAYPGGPTNVIADVGGEDYDLDIRVASGSVTIVSAATGAAP